MIANESIQRFNEKTEPRSRVRRLAALGTVAAGISLAGCSGDDSDEESPMAEGDADSPDPSEEESTTEPVMSSSDTEVSTDSFGETADISTRT